MHALVPTKGSRPVFRRHRLLGTCSFIQQIFNGLALGMGTVWDWTHPSCPHGASDLVANTKGNYKEP